MVTKQDLIDALNQMDKQPIPKSILLTVPESIKALAKKLGLEPTQPVADEFAYYYHVLKKYYYVRGSTSGRVHISRSRFNKI